MPDSSSQQQASSAQARITVSYLVKFPEVPNEMGLGPLLKAQRVVFSSLGGRSYRYHADLMVNMAEVGKKEPACL